MQYTFARFSSAMTYSFSASSSVESYLNVHSVFNAMLMIFARQLFALENFDKNTKLCCPLRLLLHILNVWCEIERA